MSFEQYSVTPAHIVVCGLLLLICIIGALISRIDENDKD